MKIELINPITRQPYPSVVAGGRTFYNLEAGDPYNIRVSPAVHYGRREFVVAVDGRDTLTNEPATVEREGIVSAGAYVCKGFRTSTTDIREFVAGEVGLGQTVAERNDSPQMIGLVFAAIYSERRMVATAILRARALESTDGPHMDPSGRIQASNRGGATQSQGIGTIAGKVSTDVVHETSWQRSGESPELDAIEYGDRVSLAARGIFFPQLNPHWPPVRRFADPNTL